MNRRNMFSLSAIAGLGLASTVMLGRLSGVAHAQTADQLVGAWRLVSAVNISPDGKKTDSFGSNPTAW